MDRIWQWAWDRYGPRYSWAVYAIYLPSELLVFPIWSFLIVALEHSDHYVEAAAVALVGVPVFAYVIGLPGLLRSSRLVEQWAAGHDVDRARALDATYAWTRGQWSARWHPTLVGRACSRSSWV
jgi:adenylate cyclase